MRSRFFALLPVILLTSLALLAVRDASAATKPGFNITASNVSVSDTGSGSSTYTATSLDGFTGQVAVSCFAPQVDGLLVIPNCDVPAQIVTVPVNGSVSGKIPFTPPSNVTARNEGGSKPHSTGPLAAGAIAMIGFAAARRRRWNRTLAPLLLVAALFAGISATGCGGHGGLAMSHGTFGYSIQAVGPSQQTATAYIKVTVN